jgi:hypothetical protein
MTKQPEALELADSLCSRYDLFPKSDEFKAAAELRRQDGEINSMRSERIGTEKELRRLHEENVELLTIIKDLQESASYWCDYEVPVGIVERMNAAVKKATGETA